MNSCNDYNKDRFGLVNVVLDIKGEKYIISDIFLRILKPRELMLMQGFPEDYIIDRDYKWQSYPIAKQVARIGNSVVPIMAKKLVEAKLLVSQSRRADAKHGDRWQSAAVEICIRRIPREINTRGKESRKNR